MTAQHRGRLRKLALLGEQFLFRGFGLLFKRAPPAAYLLFAFLNFGQSVIKFLLWLLKLRVNQRKQLLIQRADFFLADHNV